jgi:hypothetical protein
MAAGPRPPGAAHLPSFFLPCQTPPLRHLCRMLLGWAPASLAPVLVTLSPQPTVVLGPLFMSSAPRWDPPSIPLLFPCLGTGTEKPSTPPSSNSFPHDRLSTQDPSSDSSSLPRGRLSASWWWSAAAIGEFGPSAAAFPCSQ